MNRNGPLLQDIAIIFLSIFIAVVLVRTQVLANILTSTKELELIGSLIAGIFFTFLFTAVPAIVTLGDIAQANSAIITAIFGGLGAVVGDLLIFRFVRDRLSGHMSDLAAYRSSGKRLKALFKLRYFRWSTFFIGGLIIASPFPDELGISLLGFSKMKMRIFVPLSFILNSAGILVIGLIAKSL